ncbi:uncharacterized protein LOC122849243 isoform X2 [Aphidius gifuensis]|uniref:uncharacterized protein LOC122849243 isoform X2 n=1 Tax=Aphidius gifuensis TaxID=684658 RepID=UPI001CDC97D0|nr:uncharacterized protein LOC122849243 isoform X2 [Aphidius gifuensis]
MRTKSVIYYLAIGILLMGIFVGEVDARRKILRGRKTITRQYYRGLGIPAWAIILISGMGMLAIGVGFYVALKKFIVDGPRESEKSAYHPAMQNDV